MKTQLILTTLVALSLTACSTPSDKKEEAQAEYTEEKTKTLQEYKECVKKSEGAQEKMAQCEALLKAVGAVEGATIQNSAPATAPAETTPPAETTAPTDVPAETTAPADATAPTDAPDETSAPAEESTK